MSPNYFTETALRSLADSLGMIRDAIQAGQPVTGQAIATATLEGIQARLSELQGPQYSSPKQNKLLAILTGWGFYPPSYWKKLELSKAEASEAIDELKLMGEVNIRGTLYRQTERSKSKRKAA